jgi:hypothetical protein
MYEVPPPPPPTPSAPPQPQSGQEPQRLAPQVAAGPTPALITSSVPCLQCS